jgi:hypothetical protein
MRPPSRQSFANPALPVHHALALEAASCAERMLTLFEQVYRHDSRPRYAVATLRAWVQGQASMMACRQAAFAAHAAARMARQPVALAAARAGAP